MRSQTPQLKPQKPPCHLTSNFAMHMTMKTTSYEGSMRDTDAPLGRPEPPRSPMSHHLCRRPRSRRDRRQRRTVRQSEMREAGSRGSSMRGEVGPRGEQVSTPKTDRGVQMRTRRKSEDRSEELTETQTIPDW
mgnify:CR=1 FL=1